MRGGWLRLLAGRLARGPASRGVPPEGADEFSDPELREFLAGDDDRVPPAPEFRERLRQLLWTRWVESPPRDRSD